MKVSTKTSCKTCIKSDVCNIKGSFTDMIEGISMVSRTTDVSVHVNCNRYSRSKFRFNLLGGKMNNPTNDPSTELYEPSFTLRALGVGKERKI